MIRFHLVLFAMVLLCLAVGSRGFRYRRTELTPGRSSPWSFFGSTRRRTAFTTRRRYSFSSTRRRTLFTTRRRYSFSSSRRRTVFTTKYSPGFSTRRIPFPTTNPATFSTWFSTSRIPFPTIQPSNSSYIKMEDLTPALTAKALTVGYRTNVKPPTSLYKYVVHENLDPDSFNVNGNQLYTAFIMAQYNNIENCLIIPKHERYTSTRCAALFRSRVTDSTIFRLKSEFTATHSYNAPQSISLCCTCCNGSEKMLSGLTIILSVLVSFMLF
ncbi:uncharacterized protein LOC108949623 isoform X2 [Ciona intestinalis]